jgi:hypothetical protein
MAIKGLSRQAGIKSIVIVKKELFEEALSREWLMSSPGL